MKNITKLIVENDILVKRCVEKGIGLTVGQEYQILAEGNYWYMVKDDNGLTVHFAKEHFSGGKQYNGFLSNEKPNARRELFNKQKRLSDIKSNKLSRKIDYNDKEIDLDMKRIEGHSINCNVKQFYCKHCEKGTDVIYKNNKGQSYCEKCYQKLIKINKKENGYV